LHTLFITCMCPVCISMKAQAVDTVHGNDAAANPRRAVPAVELMANVLERHGSSGQDAEA